MSAHASQPPQPLSLNDLLRQHCRDRLYIQPLHWTAKHLQLLKCYFVRRQRAAQPASSSELSGDNSRVDEHPQKRQLDIDLPNAVCRLACSEYISVKQWGLKHLLEAVSNECIISLPYVATLAFCLHCTLESASHPSQ